MAASSIGGPKITDDRERYIAAMRKIASLITDNKFYDLQNAVVNLGFNDFDPENYFTVLGLIMDICIKYENYEAISAVVGILEIPGAPDLLTSMFEYYSEEKMRKIVNAFPDRFSTDVIEKVMDMGFNPNTFVVIGKVMKVMGVPNLESLNYLIDYANARFPTLEALSLLHSVRKQMADFAPVPDYIVEPVRKTEADSEINLLLKSYDYDFEEEALRQYIPSDDEILNMIEPYVNHLIYGPKKESGDVESEFEGELGEQIREMVKKEIEIEESKLPADLKVDTAKIEDYIKQETADRMSDRHDEIMDLFRRILISSTPFSKISYMEIYGQRTIDIDSIPSEVTKNMIRRFQLMGPNNPFPDERFIEERMFYCRIYDHNEEMDDYDEWYTGSCEECFLNIRKKWHAVRYPVPAGGWVGCFCSWDCVRKRSETTDDDNVTYIDRALIDIFEKQVRVWKIVDRNDDDVE